MAYLYKKCGGKFPLFNGNLVRYNLDTNYVLKMSEQKIPIFVTGSTFQDDTTYFQLRVNTDNVTEPWLSVKDDALALKFGTNSTTRSALDNLVGSLWGMEEGGETYSVDTPAVDYTSGFGWRETSFPFNFYTSSVTPIWYYFAWDLNSLTPTYMYVNLGYYQDGLGSYFATGSAGFVENGVSQKTVSLVGNRFKFVWNRTTNNAAIYRSNDLFASDFVSTPLGTYSFSATAMSLPPFYVQGIDSLSDTYELVVDTSLLDTVITNNHIGDAWKHNYNLTASTPSSQYLFNPFDKY